MCKRFIGGFALLWFIAVPLGAQIHLPVEKTVLDNGLTVLTCEDHSFPTVSYQTFVSAGSRDELMPGATGIAHVFEHMMFRGTLAHPNFGDEVARMGAQSNAYTGQDYTCYYLNVKAEFLPKVIALEADRIRNLRFSEETFRRELGPIIEERRRFVEDNADGFLEEQLYRLAFSQHTYGHPVIGWMEDLERTLAFEHADHFRRIFYSPNYVTIIVAGDFNSQETLNLIQQYYGDWPSSLPPMERIKEEPLQIKERRVRMVWKSSEIPGQLAIGYHIPDLNFLNNDFFALQVLQQAMFSESGRLSRQLKEELALVESIRAEAEGKKDPGLFVICINLLAPHYADSVLAIISSAFGEIQREGLSLAELEAARNSLKADYVYGLDRPARIVGQLGYFQIVGGDYNMMFDYYDRLSRVSNDDIRGAVSRYLNSANRSAIVLLPKAEDRGER